MFKSVNVIRYFPLQLLSCAATYLYEIRLAIDAINVPSPPKFVPVKSKSNLSVKPESKIAAGTLLIIWLDNTETRTSLPLIVFDNASLIESMLPMLPTKMKNPTKVSNRL